MNLVLHLELLPASRLAAAGVAVQGLPTFGALRDGAPPGVPVS
jgi:hypothetical protein